MTRNVANFSWNLVGNFLRLLRDEKTCPQVNLQATQTKAINCEEIESCFISPELINEQKCSKSRAYFFTNFSAFILSYSGRRMCVYILGIGFSTRNLDLSDDFRCTNNLTLIIGPSFLLNTSRLFLSVDCCPKFN